MFLLGERSWGSRDNGDIRAELHPTCLNAKTAARFLPIRIRSADNVEHR